MSPRQRPLRSLCAEAATVSLRRRHRKTEMLRLLYGTKRGRKNPVVLIHAARQTSPECERVERVRRRSAAWPPISPCSSPMPDPWSSGNATSSSNGEVDLRCPRPRSSSSRLATGSCTASLPRCRACGSIAPDDRGAAGSLRTGPRRGGSLHPRGIRRASQSATSSGVCLRHLVARRAAHHGSLARADPSRGRGHGRSSALRRMEPEDRHRACSSSQGVSKHFERKKGKGAMEDTGKLFTLVPALRIPDGTLGPNYKGSLLENRTGVTSDRTSLGSSGMHRVSGEDGDVSPQPPYRILSRPHHPQSRHGHGHTPARRAQSPTPQSMVGILGQLRWAGASR